MEQFNDKRLIFVQFFTNLELMVYNTYSYFRFKLCIRKSFSFKINTVLSANKLPWNLVCRGKALICVEKNKGPNIEPRGIPQ